MSGSDDSNKPAADTVSAAFIGLGVMGFPMAGHLARAGHRVCAFNRTRTRADAWAETNAEHAVRTAATPAGAAADADFVFMCVGNDRDVREVALGADGALAGMQPGTVLVDHTTASAELARELDAACAEKGVGFLDAPVSGGQAGAENGALTVMIGGDAAHFERAAPVMACYAKKMALLGAVGAGQLAKMVNQICIAGIAAGAFRSAVLCRKARRAGRGRSVIDVISKGAAQSWQMENRYADNGAMTSSTSALPWTGCAKTWILRCVPAGSWGQSCRSPRWSISSTRMCRRRAAAAGIRPACCAA